MFNKKQIAAGVVESINDEIDCASAEELAGLVSGRKVMFMADGNDLCILQESAQYDRAFVDCYGQMYDVGIAGLDSEEHQLLREAIQIVGEAEDCDVLEEDGNADAVRAAAINASPEFAERCRDQLRRLIDQDFIANVLETKHDNEEEARNWFQA